MITTLEKSSKKKKRRENLHNCFMTKSRVGKEKKSCVNEIFITFAAALKFSAQNSNSTMSTKYYPIAIFSRGCQVFS